MVFWNFFFIKGVLKISLKRTSAFIKINFENLLLGWMWEGPGRSIGLAPAALCFCRFWRLVLDLSWSLCCGDVELVNVDGYTNKGCFGIMSGFGDVVIFSRMPLVCVSYPKMFWNLFFGMVLMKNWVAIFMGPLHRSSSGIVFKFWNFVAHSLSFVCCIVFFLWCKKPHFGAMLCLFYLVTSLILIESNLFQRKNLRNVVDSIPVHYSLILKLHDSWFHMFLTSKNIHDFI